MSRLYILIANSDSSELQIIYRGVRKGVQRDLYPPNAKIGLNNDSQCFCCIWLSIVRSTSLLIDTFSLFCWN